MVRRIGAEEERDQLREEQAEQNQDSSTRGADCRPTQTQWYQCSQVSQATIGSSSDEESTRQPGQHPAPAEPEAAKAAAAWMRGGGESIRTGAEGAAACAPLAPRPLPRLPRPRPPPRLPRPRPWCPPWCPTTAALGPGVEREETAGRFRAKQEGHSQVSSSRGSTRTPTQTQWYHCWHSSQPIMGVPSSARLHPGQAHSWSASCNSSSSSSSSRGRCWANCQSGNAPPPPPPFRVVEERRPLPPPLPLAPRCRFLLVE